MLNEYDREEQISIRENRTGIQELTIQKNITEQASKNGQSRGTSQNRLPRMDNLEEHHRTGIQEWTIQRNITEQASKNGQSRGTSQNRHPRMDLPEAHQVRKQIKTTKKSEQHESYRKHGNWNQVLAEDRQFLFLIRHPLIIKCSD